MKRRTLNKLLLFLPGLFPVIGHPQLQIPSRIDSRITATPIQVSPLAGFQYYSGPNLWPKMNIKDELSLHREPANPYDKRAVALFWDGFKIGYLPRRENTRIAHMLDRAKKLKARVIDLEVSDNPWERIRVEVVEIIN